MSPVPRNTFLLPNNFNQQNCFLNVCLQTLWQLTPIREGLISLAAEDDSKNDHVKGLVDSLS